MSWSVSTAIPIHASELHQLGDPVNIEEPGVAEQVTAAKGAAQLLLDSGAFGDQEATYTLTLSGHSNPDHLPRSGYAADGVTISIWQSAGAVPSISGSA